MAGPAETREQGSALTYAQFRALANSMPNLAWMARPDGWVFWYNDRWYEYTGTTPEEMAGWGWQSVHRPEVLPEMLQRFTHSLKTGEPFQMIFPLRGADGAYRPFLTRMEPLRENGAIVGWYGTNTDITEQERTRERLQLMVNELNHRVKNTLATIHSIAMHTLRDLKPNSAEMFEKRLLALAAVHDVLTRENWTKAEVEELVLASIAPFGLESFEITGESVPIAPRNASALAMTLHELGTNAAKYGALSAPEGRVSINWRIDEGGYGPGLSLVWRETGGPPVTPPARKGFGMRLIERSLGSDAAGGVALDFRSEGLVCEMRIPLKAEVLS